MLTVSLSLCVIVCAFLVGRFFAAKTRLVEKDIDAAIARKLSASPMSVELIRLKEQNSVMRNLLIDMLENEGSVAQIGNVTPDERDRAMRTRVQRRREIFGETVYALQQTDRGKTALNGFKITG